MNERLDEINGLLGELNDGAIDQLRRHVKENEIDQNQGAMPFEEAITMLIRHRDILISTLDEIGSLPQRKIEECFDRLHGLVVNLRSQNITAFVGEVINLEAFVWEARIGRRSESEVNYEKKLKQLDTLLAQARKNENTWKSLIDRSTQLELHLAEFTKTAKTAVDSAQESLAQIQESESTSGNLRDNIVTFAETSRINSEQSISLLTTISANNERVNAITAILQGLSVAADTFRDTIGNTQRKADETIASNTKQMEQLLTQLKGIEENARKQLQLATGVSLFHSFDARKKEVAKAKQTWAIGLVVAIVVAIVAAGLIAVVQASTPLYWYLKLAATPPLIFAVWFCSAQYTRERKLEEEYAFKSNISVSLEAYRDLVQKMVTTHPMKRVGFG